MSSCPLSQSYFLSFVITFCSAVTEGWIITCNLACSSSPCSHPGAYKLLSMASFNFQAKRAADTKGPCGCFSSSANYASLGQRGAEVGQSWPDLSVFQQLDSSRFGSRGSWNGRAGPSRQGHGAAGFPWHDGVHLSLCSSSRFWELAYFAKSGNGKAMFSVPVWL